MMHIFAASSLYQAIQTLHAGVKKRQSYLTVIPGLHLNTNIVQFQIELLQKSTKRPENVIWHDAINNSLTPTYQPSKAKRKDLTTNEQKHFTVDP